MGKNADPRRSIGPFFPQHIVFSLHRDQHRSTPDQPTHHAGVIIPRQATCAFRHRITRTRWFSLSPTYTEPSFPTHTPWGRPM